MLYIPRHWVRDEIGGDGAIGFRETLIGDKTLIEAISATTEIILANAPCLAIEHLRDGLIDRLRRHLGVGPRGQERRDASVARRALDYLQSNYAPNVSSADLVQASGAASRFQLTRSFRESYGTAPHTRLAEIRLAKARALLRQGVAPSRAVASCGFADQSHMTRWFQQAYGIPTGAYGRGRTNVQDMTQRSVYWAQNQGQKGAPMYDTKIAILADPALETWQKLNVTAFLASGITGALPHAMGEP